MVCAILDYVGRLYFDSCYYSRYERFRAYLNMSCFIWDSRKSKPMADVLVMPTLATCGTVEGDSGLH
jgi:hypothetical protein